MKITKIETSKAPNPAGWYSQAYKVGDMVYTAGVIAWDPETQELVCPGDVKGQTIQILKNMEQILIEAGSDLEHVVKTLVFIRNTDDFAVFNETYKTFFPNNPPARSTIQVGNFAGEMMIEIEAIAVCK